MLSIALFFFFTTVVLAAIAFFLIRRIQSGTANKKFVDAADARIRDWEKRFGGTPPDVLRANTQAAELRLAEVRALVLHEETLADLQSYGML